jgi:hypothetical protein
MKIYQAFFAVSVIGSTLFLSGCGLFSSNDENLDEFVINTSSGTYSYLVEIADETEERKLGLMHRESLGENRGMLFVYEQEMLPAFWMKNMQIPLDMIFMDKNFKVVDYFENVPPCEEDPCERYRPVSKSKYILEVPAGTADEIMLAKGDMADWKTK